MAASILFSLRLPLLILLLLPMHSFAGDDTQTEARGGGQAAGTAGPPQKGFLNIDCGATTKSMDGVSLTWVGDGAYVHSGVSHQVSNSSITVDRFRTVRSFPRGKKNCYTVPVAAGAKLKVRTEFIYGNYDGLEKPPEFSIMCESTVVSLLQTDMDVEAYWVVSCIFTTRSAKANICFGREHDDQDPFVSSIQVAVLDQGMYPELNSSFVLKEIRKVAFGVDNPIRYPDDAYDRIWTPSSSLQEGFTYTQLRSNATKPVNTSTAVDRPPAKMFGAAASPPEGETNLTIRVSSIDDEIFYMNLYFSEVWDLTGSRLSRSFDIYLNEKLLSEETVVPPLGSVLEKTVIDKGPTNPKLTLVPSKNSTLPPIISGLEILYIFFAESNGTLSSDVEGLAVLQDSFESLKNWSGDPCLPLSYNWEWVNCTTDLEPRVATLSLAGYGLSGRLPDFSSLDALEEIYLQNNSLTGAVPDFLGSLPNLRVLNLAYNGFTSLPPSLKANKRIKLNTTGNPCCDINPPPPEKTNGVGKTIAPFFAVLLLLASLWTAVV